jgi:zinc protease
MFSRASLSPRLLLAILTMTLAFSSSDLVAANAVRATEFRLDNGMQVVVIPDNRAPVVTHMVWYRVGSADEPRGVSGIAHFLEHLMFKSTEKIATGQFSKIVSRLGGQDNAFTSQDATAYFQRVAKDRLRQVMDMEADRMINLKLEEKDVLTERDVILEERRSRVENNPSAILDEQMGAALYLSHPYGIPVIGWEHEMAKLSREDALKFYKRYYAPNNAILVVSGDVTPAEVKALATETYGRVSNNPAVTPRTRVSDPEHRSPRRVEYKDARAGRPVVQRYYIAPSYMTAKSGDAEALDLLFKIIGSGSTSRMYQSLVSGQKVASSAGGWYSGIGMDSGKMSVYGVPTDGVTLEALEKAIDGVIAEVKDKGVTAEELERAKKAYLAEYIYESDNQATLARRYGWAIVVGRSVADVEGWPDAIAKVTVEDVTRVARQYLDTRRSVTGLLIPDAAPGAAPRPAAPLSLPSGPAVTTR